MCRRHGPYRPIPSLDSSQQQDMFPLRSGHGHADPVADHGSILPTGDRTDGSEILCIRQEAGKR